MIGGFSLSRANGDRLRALKDEPTISQTKHPNGAVTAGPARQIGDLMAKRPFRRQEIHSEARGALTDSKALSLKMGSHL